MKPAQHVLQQMRQIARDESAEFLKSAKGQVVQPKETSSESPDVSEVSEKQTFGTSPADLLEQDMQRYRELRRQRDDEIRRQQELEYQQRDDASRPDRPVMSTSKPQKGRLRGMKAKVQQMQLGGEARAGKGKN